MKILTIAAAATALALSSAGAFADGKGGHGQQLRDEFYDTAAGVTDGPAIVDQRGAETPAPSIDDTGKVSRSVYRVSAQNGRVARGEAVQTDNVALIRLNGAEAPAASIDETGKVRSSMYRVSAHNARVIRNNR